MIAIPKQGAGTPTGEDDRGDTVTLGLTGDVMTGRGIDQVLPHPGDPRLYEPQLDDARDYVALAEAANGPIPKPVDFAYVWGDALGELERRRPLLRLVNLETAVTARTEPAPKGINYKMNPANMPVLAAAGIEICALANNHLLDWGRAGLIDTLDALRRAGIQAAGAGRNQEEAAAPALFPIPGGGRVLVFAFGSPSSGIPQGWAASADRSGIDLLPDLGARSLGRVAKQIGAARRPGDIVVASIHWGGNWGYEIPAEQIAFAHKLVDEAGVDLLHGHSSHHPRAIEVYRGRLILYGCGDFLDDYEGIAGEERYRDDLVLMYLPSLRRSDGALASLTMVPFQIRNFRLNRAGGADAAWLADTLSREGRKFATRASLGPDGALALGWQ